MSSSKIVLRMEGSQEKEIEWGGKRNQEKNGRKKKKKKRGRKMKNKEALAVGRE